jgi:hypothetical protein
VSGKTPGNEKALRDHGSHSQRPDKRMLPKGSVSETEAPPSEKSGLSTFFLPDYTVGAGIPPVLAGPVKDAGFAGYTAGRELLRMINRLRVIIQLTPP